MMKVSGLRRTLTAAVGSSESSWDAALAAFLSMPRDTRTVTHHWTVASQLVQSAAAASTTADAMARLNYVAPLRWEFGQHPDMSTRLSSFRAMIAACVQASETCTVTTPVREALATSALITLSEANLFGLSVTLTLLSVILSSRVIAECDRTLLPNLVAFHATRLGPDKWTARDDESSKLMMGVGFSKAGMWQEALAITSTVSDGFLKMIPKLTVSQAVNICTTVAGSKSCRTSIPLMMGCAETVGRLAELYPYNQWAVSCLLPLLENYDGPRLPVAFMRSFITSGGGASFDQRGLELYDRLHRKANFALVMGSVLDNAVAARQWKRALELFSTMMTPRDYKLSLTWELALTAAMHDSSLSSAASRAVVDSLTVNASSVASSSFFKQLARYAMLATATAASTTATKSPLDALNLALDAKQPIDPRIALAATTYAAIAGVWESALATVRRSGAPLSLSAAAAQGLVGGLLAQRNQTALVAVAYELCVLRLPTEIDKLYAAAALIAMRCDTCALLHCLAGGVGDNAAAEAAEPLIARFSLMLRDLCMAVRINKSAAATATFSSSSESSHNKDPVAEQTEQERAVSMLLSKGFDGLYRVISLSTAPQPDGLSEKRISGGWESALFFLSSIKWKDQADRRGIAAVQLINAGFTADALVEHALAATEAATSVNSSIEQK